MGVWIPHREGDILGFFSSIGLNGVYDCIGNVFDSCEKLAILPYAELLLNAVFKIYFGTRSKLAFTRNLQKCNSEFMKKSRVAAPLLQVSVGYTSLEHCRLCGLAA